MVVVFIDLVWCEGDVVLVIGCGLSEICDGGYSQYVWLVFSVVIVQLAGLILCEVMILGMVGFIVVLVLLCMFDNWLMFELGLLVVIGVIGGVGLLVVDIFSQVGFEVYVISGKVGQVDYLCGLGVCEVLLCEVLVIIWLMELVCFGGGLDNVGGLMLVSLLVQIVLYGSVVSVGFVVSFVLDMMVMFFIICGVLLLGVLFFSVLWVLCEKVWDKFGSEWWLCYLECICIGEVGLDGLFGVFEWFLVGGGYGCMVV